MLPVAQVKKLLRELPAGGTLINGYGPTENTTFSCCHGLTARSRWQGSVPIGRPIANTEVYVVDSRLQPVPRGVAGELLIGGEGLARGYYQRPELTAERFIPHPFSGVPGARLYRSGDRGRYLASGEIEFLGRFDYQVKLRGFRIEPGEIESRLNAHPAIRAALVVLAEEEGRDRELVAYVVAQPQQAPLPGELRSYLQASLPPYMIPGVFVLLAELPLTANGKVDRQALPAPGGERPELASAYVAPRSEREAQLARLWSAVLGRERVGVRDNFFELGGHSLLATLLVSKMRQTFKVEIPLRTLFEHPTIAQLSTIIEQSLQAQTGRQAQSIQPVARTSELPLSFAQQRLWFMDQFEPGNAAYNIPIAVRIGGPLDIPVLERSLSEIVRSHEPLRTSFDMGPARKPEQVISPAHSLPLTVCDLQDVPATERGREAARVAEEEARLPFDLQHGPLLRASLVRLSLTEHLLLLTMHHIISDGWSMGILIREVVALYQAFSQEQPSPLSELSIQYADFAQWQREWLQGEVLEEQLAYWRQQLGGELPVLDLPLDKRRPPQPSYRGARQTFTLAADLTEELKRLGQREGVTLFMTLLAGFQTLLYLYSGQED